MKTPQEQSGDTLNTYKGIYIDDVVVSQGHESILERNETSLEGCLHNDVELSLTNAASDVHRMDLIDDHNVRLEQKDTQVCLMFCNVLNVLLQCSHLHFLQPSQMLCSASYKSEAMTVKEEQVLRKKTIRHKSADFISTSRRRLAALQQTFNSARGKSSNEKYDYIDGQFVGVQARPPSRHKPPPQSIGLELSPPSSAGNSSSYGVENGESQLQVSVFEENDFNMEQSGRPFGGLPTQETTDEEEDMRYYFPIGSPKYRVPIIVTTMEDKLMQERRTNKISKRRLANKHQQHMLRLEVEIYMSDYYSR